MRKLRGTSSPPRFPDIPSGLVPLTLSRHHYYQRSRPACRAMRFGVTSQMPPSFLLIPGLLLLSTYIKRTSRRQRCSPLLTYVVDSMRRLLSTANRFGTKVVASLSFSARPDFNIWRFAAPQISLRRG